MSCAVEADARPDSGRRSRRTVCAVVVLPQPDSPTSASISPRPTVNETPSTARHRASAARRAIVPNEPAGDRIADDEILDREQRARSSSRPPPPARRSGGRRRERPPATVAQERPLVLAPLERAVAPRRGTGSPRSSGRAAAARPGSRPARPSPYEIGRRREQQPRVRDAAARGTGRRPALLDDLAGVHHGRAVADLRHDRQVVRHQHQREARDRGRARRSSSRICACTITSSAVVGSSASSTLGSQASAIAIAARWRIPPENSCG